MTDAPHRLLDQAPGQVELFQAIRLLEQAARAEHGEVGRVGEAAHPNQEPVRFRARPGTAFPAGEIAAYANPAPSEAGAAAAGTARPELAVNAFGLFGASGALPQAYTDLLSEELRARETALRDFLDVFNHRLIALFYRAWAKYRLPIAFERGDAGAPEDASGARDPVTESLFALIGLGLPSLKQRSAVPDAVLLYYGGLFARQVRNADSLAALLSDDFDRPIRVHQFQGRWLHLDTGEHTRVGAMHSQLGVDAVAGAKVWDVQGSFTLSVGPLSYDAFLDFMPGGVALTRLAQLTRLYVGPALAFNIQVILRRDAVPGVCLGATGGRAPRLGWNTWATEAPLPHDAGDAVFASAAAEAAGTPDREAA
jgi:type VI secretion system protein ImpH